MTGNFKMAKRLLFHAFAGVVFVTQPALAKMSCEGLSGDWSGRMSGKFTGATTMTVKPNCRLRWRLPDGRINSCKYKEKAGKVEYSCSLGSHGSVVINGTKITMQNIYTARKHGAYKVQFSKNSE